MDVDGGNGKRGTEEGKDYFWGLGGACVVEGRLGWRVITGEGRVWTTVVAVYGAWCIMLKRDGVFDTG
jgi:hypothetical protein